MRIYWGNKVIVTFSIRKITFYEELVHTKMYGIGDAESHWFIGFSKLMDQ